MNLKQHIQELRTEIFELKQKRKAVILAHSYQSSYVQDVADFVGSSLQLAQKAQNIDCQVIVFAGVDFMANTAKILNPDKTVLIPDNRARCPLAKMLNPEDIIKAKEKYPKAPVLLYTNTSAECQALADIIFTAGNTLDIVDKMTKQSGSDVIIFGQDVNIAYFVGKRLNCKGEVKTREGIKKIKDLEKGERLLYVPSYGYCAPHIGIFPETLEKERKKYPDAKILVHSECYPEVQELADFVGSTGDMVKYVKNSQAKEFLIGTETGFCYKLKTDIPEKHYYPLGGLNEREILCPHMKLHSLERVRDSLKFNMYEVNVPKNIARNARRAIKAMI